MVTLPVFFAELFPFVVFSSGVVSMCSFDTVQGGFVGHGGGVVRGWPKCGAWWDNVRGLTMVTPPTFFFSRVFPFVVFNIDIVSTLWPWCLSG